MLSNQAIFGAVAAFSAALLLLAMSAPLGFHQGYEVLGFFCHQLPERSFHSADHAWGLCARSTGIYLGILLLYLALITDDKLRLYRPLFYLSLVSLGVIVVEKIIYIAIGLDTENMARMAIGIGFGMSASGSFYWLLQKHAPDT